MLSNEDMKRYEEMLKSAAADQQSKTKPEYLTEVAMPMVHQPVNPKDMGYSK